MVDFLNMTWRDARYTLPLELPPRIQRITVGDHRPGDGKGHDHFPGHWYVHLYSYRAELTIQGQVFPIEAGYAGLIPPTNDVTCRYEGRSSHLHAHFIPREGAGAAVEIPVMQDLGTRFLRISDRFSEAIRFFRTQPERAEARLLDILWELAQPPAEETDERLAAAPTVVREACHLIDQHLYLRLTVPFVAAPFDLSPDYLTQLFRQHLGTTVVAYIRQRRVLRAQHLLLHSWLPIKAIAQQVGIPDQHLFNKTIRRELGAAPSKIRDANR